MVVLNFKQKMYLKFDVPALSSRLLGNEVKMLVINSEKHPTSPNQHQN